MQGSARVWRVAVVGFVLAVAAPAAAQSSARPSARVSVHVNAARRGVIDGPATLDAEVATAITVESPQDDDTGAEYALDMRHAKFIADSPRADRFSVYNGYAGLKAGGDLVVRVRAGHLWLNDLGTMGNFAGALLEIGQRQQATGSRVRAGVFAGVEPEVYGAGYVPNVRKYGGYAALESGYLRRHLLGFTVVKQGALTERTVLSFTNFVPAGRRFFAYQAAEFEVKGPAQGNAARGLSYFVANARLSASSRIELSGTYNRGRSIDARRLTTELLNDRALTARDVEGLQYESAGARVTVEVVPQTRAYAGYTRDRTNRDDVAIGRTTLGGYAGNVLSTGIDVSASTTRVQRASGPYRSSYFSLGRSLGRALYVSGDYSTSLSTLRFVRSDGLVIETRPSMRRYSGSASAVLTRSISLLFTADYTVDDDTREVRILSGLSYRLR